MGRGIAVLLAGILLALATAGTAMAGPVILGGDDLTDHGSADSAGVPQKGWLYTERALGNISPKVTRPNDNSIAALGSTPAAATESGNAGADVGLAASRLGLGITYYDGAAGIDDFFNKLNAGTVRPKIIWLAGSEASNDFSDSGGCSGTEMASLVTHAKLIDQFVSTGGGLMSHGVCYQWATALLPGLKTVESGSSDDLTLTPEGVSAFPGVTNDDINAGPWHNHFEGDLGGLQALARSGNVKDTAGQPAAVILGGGAVSITPPPPPTCVNPTVVRDRKVKLAGGGQAVLATRQFGDAATPFQATVRLTRQTATAVSYAVNGKIVAVNVKPGVQVPVPASVLKPGRQQNTMVAAVALASGKSVVITQHFVILRCTVPKVSCKRTGDKTLRCSTRTPLGVRRVTVSAASPAGGRAVGSAPVSRGKYTVTLRSAVSLPPGVYLYRHVGTTGRRGEKMTMVRQVTVS
ncbi:MAG: hypothetical protein QOE65_2054 [Solirubrobacteraceae bacterium]|jgi:hypothetical protein|nr:hypothetical protein [Solirubrobacteraceae bacterium]